MSLRLDSALVATAIVALVVLGAGALAARLRRSVAWGAGASLAALGGVVFLVAMPLTPVGIPRDVTHANLACGELRVTQTFTGTTELYTVFLYFKSRGDAGWRQYLVDNDSPYWWGRLSVEQPDHAHLSIYGLRRATFRCSDQRIAFSSGQSRGDSGVVVRDPLHFGAKR